MVVVQQRRGAGGERRLRLGATAGDGGEPASKLKGRTSAEWIRRYGRKGLGNFRSVTCGLSKRTFLQSEEKSVYL